MSFEPLDMDVVRSRVSKRDDERPFARYFDDPVAFAADVLGEESWDRQAEFLRAVAANDLVALKGGQKISKTNSLAKLMLWFVCTRPGARVIYTNSSARQVRTVNWKELCRLYRKGRAKIGGEQFRDPDRGLVFDDGREVLGFATDTPDRWGGISGENLLFIIDEASGVPEEIFDAILGNTAGDNAKVVLTGNPLRSSGYFYEIFRSKPGWKTLTISSLETPNYRQGREVIRGLASRKWRKQMEDDYGADGPIYAIRVLGNFAEDADQAVIGLSLVEAAAARYEDAVKGFDKAGPLEIGVDVARFGKDATVIAVRRGLVVLPLIEYRLLDGPAIAARVAEVAARFRRNGEQPRVKIDVIGVGASPYDALKAYEWLDVVAVDVAQSATDGNFARLRDQLWFSTRDWLKDGGAIPEDRKLHGELTAAWFSFDVRGNRRVESKEEIRKKLHGRSPDRADAVALAVFSGYVPINEATYDAPGESDRMGLSAGELANLRRVEAREWESCVPSNKETAA